VSTPSNARAMSEQSIASTSVDKAYGVINELKGEKSLSEVREAGGKRCRALKLEASRSGEKREISVELHRHRLQENPARRGADVIERRRTGSTYGWNKE